MPEPTQTISFTLNGEAHEVDVRAGETLLETLRERCGVKSTKDGCSPQGQCGCCLALIDGNPKVTCATPAAKAAGKEILTLEGLSQQERDATARAFVAAAGLQCGFCIPGFALRAKNLLDKNPSPTRAEIAKAVDVHLCRCTGYVKIIDAIELMAAERRGEAKPELCTDGKVGDSLARYRGLDLVLGDRDYVDDMRPAGLLHGHVVLSEHARAKVLGIDTSAAEAIDGVVRVATAADVPGERFYGLIHADWPGLVAVGEEVKCVGDVLAVVVAEDARTARDACAAVKVDYEVLEAITDPEQSIKPGAARANRVMPNQLSRSHIERGDVKAALQSSEHVVEESFETQRIEHLYLEPESALARPVDDAPASDQPKLRVYTQGQGIFDDQRQIAAFLALPASNIDVELVPNGGAFGGKEDMSIQAHAALMALLTRRPVKITLTREQSIRLHPKRHPIRMKYRVGCDANGRLTAVEVDMIGDTGAYASVGAKVLERAAGHACGPYRVDNVRVTAIAAYTNNPPCGAMRGFGANQAHFAMESCMDMLAEKVGLDPFEMRWLNALEVGDIFSTGQVLDKSVGIKKTLAAVKDAYYQAKGAGKAVGIGCGLKNSGIGNGAVEWGKTRIVIEHDGTISIYNGFTEMGQGLLTLMIQFAVDVTGLDPGLFRPKIDSTFELGCGQTTGSRATLLGGRSVLAAAEKLKAALDSGKSLDDLRGEVFAGDIKIDDTTKLGTPADKIKTHTAFGYATQVCILDEHGKLERFIAAHDVGKAVNPALCAGQIEGSVHMGLGFALTEELPCENGMPVTFKLREIGVLRARDMPEVDVILVEEHEPEGPRGAKGVGEIGLVPTAGAVAGALYAFDGVRRTKLPMKDSATARAISVGKIRNKRTRN